MTPDKYYAGIINFSDSSEILAMKERQRIEERLKQEIISTRAEITPHIPQMPMGEGPSRPDSNYQPIQSTKEYKPVPSREVNNSVVYCG
jgi:hypothetical protein